MTCIQVNDGEAAMSESNGFLTPYIAPIRTAMRQTIRHLLKEIFLLRQRRRLTNKPANSTHFLEIPKLAQAIERCIPDSTSSECPVL
jgi:hypothetical protein